MNFRDGIRRYNEQSQQDLSENTRSLERLTASGHYGCMKLILLILLLAGLGYIGLQLNSHFGEPIQEALQLERAPSREDPRAAYRSKLSQLERQVFGPLKKSSGPIPIQPLLQQLGEDVANKKISRTDEARIRLQLSALQQAHRERSRFTAQYQSITQSDKASFDPDVKKRRTELQLQDLERRWAEASQRMKITYQRSLSAP